MVLCKIASESLQLSISPKGAELTSVRKVGQKHNWIWSAEPLWARHAPILFPIVGRLKSDSYVYEGKNYQLPQHGFARDLEFECVRSSAAEAVYQLKSTNETRERYPFDFNLEITYQVFKSSFSIAFRVRNESKCVMPFSLGWHPGFVLPHQEAEVVQLSASEDFGPFQLLQEGLLADRCDDLRGHHKVTLSSQSFARDAWVFTHKAPQWMQIVNESGDEIRMDCCDAPYFGIWSKDAKKFVCLEPWWGVADSAESSGDLLKKPGIQLLKPDQVWNCEVVVTVKGEREDS